MDARLGERGVALLVSGLLALGAAMAACDDGRGDECDAYSSCAYGPVALNGETFEFVEKLQASALARGELTPVGVATATAGRRVQVAESENPVVPPAHLVSAAPDGWFVWRPVAIAAVLHDFGDGARIVSINRVEWPDACLGVAEPGESCTSVITPGYRIRVGRVESALVTEYHTDLAGHLRIAFQCADCGALPSDP